MNLPNSTTVRITRIGADGDGVGALADGTTLYLAGTLPGELVRARVERKRGEGWAGVAEEIVEPSPERVAPGCGHFGACGGCSLQHWRGEAYAGWKAGLLRGALQRAGYDGAVAPLVTTPAGARRRVDLALRRRGAAAVVGLHAGRSAELVDLRECPVLHPALFGLVAPLRGVLGGLDLLRREGSAVVNLLDAGPDLLLRSDAAPSAADRTRLAEFARAQGLCRVAWAQGSGPAETVCGLRPATTMLSGVAVRVPPGAFLQASAEGEAAILAAVLAGLPAKLPAKARIAELYAGCGTLSFALAGRARVAAYEGDAGAAAALAAAVNGNGLAGRITVERRDLARRPLMAAELAGCAAVVLDPPHAGAAAQMVQVAAARPGRVVYVSCNPMALARDAAVLRGAGYAVVGATPIDLFLWSARLESVVTFAYAR